MRNAECGTKNEDNSDFRIPCFRPLSPPNLNTNTDLRPK